VLSAEDRALLLDWMSGNATGDTLVRAGAPAGWSVADKSGGAGGIRNDVAVVTPPGRDAVVLSILSARNDPEADYDDALVARAAAVVLGALR
jgi:beta-lactamase class A